ncbi:MAG: nif-specific transcriptional activator NifA [Methylococcaceae bacterium]
MPTPTLNLNPEKSSNLELIAIYEIGKFLSSSLDVAKTIRDVLNILSSYMQMNRSMVSLVQDNGEVHVVGAMELSTEEMARGHFQKGEGIIGKVIRTGLPIIIHNVAEEPSFLNRTGSRNLDDGRQITFVAVPIKTEQATIGVLSIDRDMGAHKGRIDQDVQLLKMVANLIGQSIRLHQLVANEREQRMVAEYRLQKAVKRDQDSSGLTGVIGQSEVMREVFVDVERAAEVNSTVLIRGETGTGKEVIAHAIHHLSARRDGPFVRVNCGALSETLLESELFGHEKGAYTGATQERKGRFETAHGGTLFLDEIGDVSPAFQVKLLRVLQEREFERVGGNKAIKVDVRLITATNRNLEEAVLQGEFRADLYYRINVITLLLPPLRERREDIQLLVDHFLNRFNEANQRHLSLSPEALQIFSECYWPGNVRELENCVERTAAMTKTKLIRDINLPCQKNMCFSMALKPIAQMGYPVPHPNKLAVTIESEPMEHDSARQQPEPKAPRERLIWAMDECGWVQAKAARLLGMTTRQLNYALQKYHIEIRRF